MSNSFCSSFLPTKLFYISFFVLSFLSKSTIPRDLFYPGCASAIFCYVLKKDLAKKKVTFSECLSVEIVVPEQDEEESDEKSNDGFSGIDSLLEF